MVYETKQIETSHSFQSRQTSQAGLQLKKCWIDSPKGRRVQNQSNHFFDKINTIMGASI